MVMPVRPGQRLTRAAMIRLLARDFDETAWAMVIGLDCHLRIGNGPPAVGREEALRSLKAFYDRIRGFGGFCESWQRREAIFVETEVLFQHDRLGALHLPCTVIARTTDGLLRDVRFHLDPTPIP